MKDKLTAQIGFRTTEDIKNKVRERALFEDRTESYIINRALKEYFDKIEEAKKLLNKKD